MEKSVYISDIVYIDPPWRSVDAMLHSWRYCELEKSIYYHQVQLNIEWEREWANFRRQDPHDFMGLPQLLRPKAVPPMVHGPRGTVVVVID